MPEIIGFPTTRVAYVTEIGPYDTAMPRGFDRLFAWLRQNNIQPTASSIAIFYDAFENVPGEQQRCDTCAPVDSLVPASGNVRTKDLGAKEAASTVYQGRDSREQAYTDVYRWIAAQGYRATDAPFEVYLSQLGQELRAQVVVPVEKDKKAGRKTSAVKRERGAAAKRPTRRPKHPVGPE